MLIYCWACMAATKPPALFVVNRQLLFSFELLRWTPKSTSEQQWRSLLLLFDACKRVCKHIFTFPLFFNWHTPIAAH